MHDEITQEIEVRFPDTAEPGRRREPGREPGELDLIDLIGPEEPLPSRIGLRPSDIAGPLAVFGIGAFLLWMGLTHPIDLAPDAWTEPAESSAPTEVEERPAPRPVAAAPREPAVPVAPPPQEAVSPAPEEAWIQLLSGRSSVGAASARDRLVGEHADLLEALSPTVVRADLGSRGVYFRVRAGPLESAEAESVCAALAARNQSCIVFD